MRPTGKINFFRTSATDKAEGIRLADYLTGTRGYTTVAIINDPGPYGSDFAQEFTKEWEKDTNKTPTQTTLPPITDESEYGKVISQIATSNPLPDVVFYAGQAQNATLIHTLMEENQKPQFKTTAFAGGGGIISAGFLTNMNGLQSGPVYAVAPVGSVFSPNSTNGLGYYTSYTSSYDGLPTVYAASAYDCTQIVINALKMAINSNPAPTGPHDMSRAESLRQAVIADIQKESYPGVTGHYSFSNNGNSNGDSKGDPDNGGTTTLYQFNSTSQTWIDISGP